MASAPSHLDPSQLPVMPYDQQTSVIGDALYARVCAFGPEYKVHAAKFIGYILDQYQARGCENMELVLLLKSPRLHSLVAEAARTLSISLPPPCALPVAQPPVGAPAVVTAHAPLPAAPSISIPPHIPNIITPVVVYSPYGTRDGTLPREGLSLIHI